MCEPVTIVTGLAIASAAAGAYGTQQQAKAQYRSLREQRQAQAEEIRTKESIAMGERVKQARAERARLRVAAGEAGVTGVSFEETLLDSFFQQDQDLAIISKDAEFQQRAGTARYNSGVSQVKNQGLLESGLQIASAGYSGYSSGLQISNTRQRTGGP